MSQEQPPIESINGIPEDLPKKRSFSSRTLDFVSTASAWMMGAYFSDLASNPETTINVFEGLSALEDPSQPYATIGAWAFYAAAITNTVRLAFRK